MFELRTRQQFAGLIAKRALWHQQRESTEGALFYDQGLGIYWAKHNCSLEESEQASSWHAEVLEEERARQLQFHLQASCWFSEKAQGEAVLTSSDLLRLHSLLMGQAEPQAENFRQVPAGPLAEGHDPAEWELIPDLVENSLEWFGSASFGEMHEVERTALMLVKLIDIQPFQHNNGKTLRLFSNFFLLKAGYPPAIIRSEQARSYALAIENALHFETGPLVALLTECLNQSLALCLGEPTKPSPFVVLG